MFLKKKANSYDSYTAELSYAELMALQAAGEQAGDPIADEAAKAISWFFSHEVPPPGVDEHPSKAAKEDPEIDDLLPDGAEVEVTPPSAGNDMLPVAPTRPAAPNGTPSEEEEVSVADETEELLPAPNRGP